MTDTSNMTPGPDGEDRDARIAEYVLGTLTGEARAAFELELARDESLRRAVADWSERLQPLADSIAPVAPPSRCATVSWPASAARPKARRGRSASYAGSPGPSVRR